MGGEAHVMAGFANFKKEGKRGEGKKLLLAEVSVLENKTSIFGTQDPQLCRYSENRAWSNKGMSHGHAVIFKCLQTKCFTDIPGCGRARAYQTAVPKTRLRAARMLGMCVDDLAW
jgi:hypothetical protein